MIVSPRMDAGRKGIKMLSVGIDTHQKVHQVEVQNKDGKVMWRGQIGNDRKGFDDLLLKLQTVERSNSDTVKGIFINPTGNYHVPIQHFLESSGYTVICVDARITDMARTMSNLGKEKSDRADAHMLASTPWLPGNASEKRPHIRGDESGLTRLLDSVRRNVTRIVNIISSDLACIFPEFTDIFPDIPSRTSIAILEKYTTPERIVKAGVDATLKTMQKSSRNHYGRVDAEKLIDLAGNSIGIPDASGVYAFRIRENVARLTAELRTVMEIEARILRDTGDNEDVKRIDDMKGIGPVNAASIVSEIGSIGQFDSALKLQSYGGKAPNMTGSGGKNHATGLSRVRNPYLSNAIHECAVSMVNHKNEEFLAIFNREIGKGKKPTQAYTVVGRRLLFHIYTILKNRKPYRQRLPETGKEGEGSSSAAS